MSHYHLIHYSIIHDLACGRDFCVPAATTLALLKRNLFAEILFWLLACVFVRLNYQIWISKVGGWILKCNPGAFVRESERMENGCIADLEIIIQYRWDQNKKRNLHWAEWGGWGCNCNWMSICLKNVAGRLCDVTWSNVFVRSLAGFEFWELFLFFPFLKGANSCMSSPSVGANQNCCEST